MKPKPKDIFTIVPFKSLINSKAWKNCSLYARIKAVKNLKEPKSEWIFQCYTCYRVLPFKEAVAGHCMEKRGNMGIMFEENAVHAQCYYCNRQLHGNYGEYMLHLLEEIGKEKIMELKRKASKATVYTKHQLNEIAEYYDKKIKELIQ